MNNKCLCQKCYNTEIEDLDNDLKTLEDEYVRNLQNLREKYMLDVEKLAIRKEDAAIGLFRKGECSVCKSINE